MTLLGAAATAALPACRCSREDEPNTATTPSEPDEAISDALFAPPTQQPTVRVRVLRVLRAEAATRIGAADQWMRLTFDAATGRGLVMRGVVTITRRGEQWRITDDSSTAPRQVTAPSMVARPMGFDDDTLQLNDRRYGGLLRLVARQDVGETAFDVVNELPMEQYLPGVLARELFSHWKPAAFEAQAVAARSFACYEHLHNRDRRHYDLTDTAASQAYIGTVSLETAQQATRDTGGLVLSFGDRLVPGYYSSCCGGTAAPAKSVMGANPANALAPLAGRTGDDVCTNAPVYRWTISRSRKTFSARLAAYGSTIGNDDMSAIGLVKSIDVAETAPTGRPIAYQVRDHRGNVVRIGAEPLRYAANHSAAGVDDFDDALLSSHVEAVVADDTIEFTGRGFGHGVGLCQYGAQALARNGHGYLDILRWYYPGVSVVQAYDPAGKRRELIG